MSIKQRPQWKLLPHYGQIADTGDYDGRCEITDGRSSLFAEGEDDEEVLQHIVDAMNEADCDIYVDDSPLMAERAESSFWKEQAMYLASRVYAYAHMNKSAGYNGDDREPEQGSIYAISKALLPTNHLNT